MKRNNRKRIATKLCMLAIPMCVLWGCAEKNADGNGTEETKAIGNLVVSEESGSGTKPEDMQSEDEAVQVDNTEAFLEAIAPGATVILAPGYYNLSEYTEAIWDEEGEEWNRSHPYVKLRECFDGGIEVVIQDVDNLFVTGDLESAVATELVVQTRYGAVLNFENCEDIVLNGLTMGHTQSGACDESVITFSGCTDVHLSAMDLYGCGMYGFTAKNKSGNIYLQSCTIRDCEDGPFYITDPTGQYEFRNCRLSGSFGGGYYEASKDTELSFVECNFGTWETNYWYFSENAVFTNCYWEEITEYPDVESEGENSLDIDSLNLLQVKGNEKELADTYYAYISVDQQSGDTVYYPRFTLELSANGTGYCETESESFEFTWYCEEDSMLVLESEIYHYLTPYVESGDGFDKIWLMMQMNENIIWLY